MGRIRQVAAESEPVRELFEEMRRLHRRAGEPSTRDLAKRIGEGVVSHSTVHSALSGPRVPRWPVLELVVEELHGDLAAVKELWIRAREAEDRGQETTEIRLSNETATVTDVDLKNQARPAAKAAPSPFGLTNRELTVLKEVCDGLTNRAIATKLYISESTVSVHISNILHKLGVRSRTEAAALAHRLRFFT